METIEGSFAIAKTVKNCKPDVVACYPITPSTHIAEELDRMHADGEITCYVAVESEFSALSLLIGASAAGARTFTTTSSQGLALMHEVLFNAAGMRLPIVMVNSNRAMSAPLNIWNDQQDSISQRDTGWIQLYAKNNQEAIDAIPQAYKIAESTSLPTMINVDGFFLTHIVEQLEIPDEKLIEGYLPQYNPKIKLNPDNPISLGEYATPEHYQSFREDLQKDLSNAKKNVMEENREWKEITGRGYGNGLWGEYLLEDAEKVFVGMGSVVENAEVAVDEMRKQGEKVGVLNIRCFRPFPKDVVCRLDGKSVFIFEKALSLGADPPLYTELIAAMYEKNIKAKVSSVVGGLGGRDVSVEHVIDIFKMEREKKVFIE